MLAALQCLSTASLQLQAVPGLQQQLISQATGHSCHGQLTFSSRRSKLGRLRVDQQLYRLLPAGGVEVFAAPQGVVLDARTLVQSALTSQKQQQQLQQLHAAGKPQQQQSQQQQQQSTAAAEAVPGGDAVADGVQLATQKLSSSMRLEISEQVRTATACELQMCSCIRSVHMLISTQPDRLTPCCCLSCFCLSPATNNRSVQPRLQCSYPTFTRGQARRMLLVTRGSTCPPQLVAMVLVLSRGRLASWATFCMCVTAMRSMTATKTLMMTSMCSRVCNC